MNFTVSKPNESNKTVLITGAARRIGAYFTETLHALGYNVVVHYRGSKKSADTLVTKLNKNRSNSAIAVQANLSEFSSYQTLIEQTINHFGRLDVLVNNASSFYPTAVGEITDEQWHDLMASNLKAPLFLAQASTPWLKITKGCIVNMVDIHSLNPLKGYPLYSSAKSGLYALTRSLAKELGPEIRVNGISPGSILWPEGDAENSQEEKHKILNDIVMKRQGEPKDLANALTFLINENSSYITGQILAVDGGRSLA